MIRIEGISLVAARLADARAKSREFRNKQPKRYLLSIAIEPVRLQSDSSAQESRATKARLRRAV